MIDIVKPTLIIDEQKCQANIKRMADKARANNLKFRPHFKTHQSRVIGNWFREEGVSAITVSSLGMAEYFALDGWGEITVAFPCNIKQIDLINRLASEISLNLLVDNPQVVDLLTSKLEFKVKIFIELDSGNNRSGIDINAIDDIGFLLKKVNDSPLLNLKGLYTHAGHTYASRDENEIKTIYYQVNRCLSKLNQIFRNQYPDMEICYGDTPSCSVINKFENIDAISPGNFVFFDLMQVQIGACNIDQIATVVACPVVSVNKLQNQICIYGGAVHFSKEFLLQDDRKIFGKMVMLSENGWKDLIEDTYLIKLSQEHGIIKMKAEEIAKIKIGDVIGVLPIHSCLTADCLGEYYLKEGLIIDHYK
jgi:D-serine deaminase-like pyridoxal phosphate-dependent protein